MWEQEIWILKAVCEQATDTYHCKKSWYWRQFESKPSRHSDYRKLRQQEIWILKAVSDKATETYHCKRSGSFKLNCMNQIYESTTAKGSTAAEHIMSGIRQILPFVWLLGNPRKAKAVSLATAVLEIFVNSGLAGGKYIRDVYAVAALWLESGVQFTVIAKNKVNKRLCIHIYAEENLLHALAMILRPGDRITYIKLWINFSPCWNCSEKIRQFLRGINASTDISFQHLYKIKDKLNVEGLIKLKTESGVGLSVFDEEEWRRFAAKLGFPDTLVPETRCVQDKRNHSHLQNLLDRGRNKKQPTNTEVE